jgi:transcriptional repressor NF-X1
MSSFPNQSTGAAPTLEPTEIRNSHRNRDYRSNAPGDFTGTEETGFHREQRQTANRRRRHKPSGSNADGPHTTPSTIVTSEPDAATLRPQSDRTAAAAGRSPASARTPSRNRNRLPNGRAVTSQAQDVKPPASRQSGQWRRSKPADSGSKADALTPTSGPNSQRRRNKVPTGDDLTSILTFSLSNPPFPECMICFNPIRPEQHTWSCSPGEEKEAQSCWNTFHLKCVQSWASKSVKDMEEAWRARGEERKGEWRCPGCQLKREIVPQRYW